MGSSGVVRPPILTPSERTIWVSALLVSIAVCIAQVGHSYTMDIEPSNGPCVDFRAIGWSQGTHKNFTLIDF